VGRRERKKDIIKDDPTSGKGEKAELILRSIAEEGNPMRPYGEIEAEKGRWVEGLLATGWRGKGNAVLKSGVLIWFLHREEKTELHVIEMEGGKRRDGGRGLNMDCDSIDSRAV